MNSLSKISNIELEGRLKDLVMKERKLLHVILEHIKEVDTRKLFLERAYPSMFEYLVKELGYSGSAAMRRLEAARLLREIPSVSEKIQEGSLNLSQICELSKVVKEKERTTGGKVSGLQKTELVSMIAGKTTLETQKELSLALDVPIKEFETKRIQKNESIRVEMTFSKEQYEKLLQCKDLAAHLVHQSCKDSSLASLIEILADQYLKKIKAKAKADGKSGDQLDNSLTFSKVFSSDGNNNNISNNDKDDENKSGIGVNPRFQPICGNKSATNTEKSQQHPLDSAKREFNEAPPLIRNTSQTESKRFMTPKGLKNDVKAMFTAALEGRRVNKSVTPKTRREILARDLCCQFKDPVTGKQCRSTYGAYGLQVDHRHSLWAGGDSSHGNLQNLCFQHNQYKYKKEANLIKRLP